MIGVLCRERLVDVDSQSRALSGMHKTFFEVIRVWKHRVSFVSVAHVFLNTEIVDGKINMERRRHAYRAQIRSAVRSHSHLIYLGQVGDLFQVCNSARMNDGRTDIVDQLLLDKLLAVKDRVKHFADRKRSCRVATDQAKSLLHLGGGWVFHPEEMIRFQALADSGGFDWCEAVMAIVQQMKLGPEFVAEPAK